MERAYAITSVPPQQAGALGHRKPAALGEGRGVRRGPELGANRVGAATAGGTAELGNRHAKAERGQNISAALRHYAWKPWETLLLIGLPRDNEKTLRGAICDLVSQ